MPPTDASTDAGTTPVTDLGADPGPGPGTDNEDTLDLRLPDELLALLGSEVELAGGDDLLDRIGGWGPIATPVGAFHLVPVRVERDLPLVSRWMNDPAVAEFWELAGPESVAEEHLCRQLDGDGRSVPCLGVLDGTPMSYWEIYRADLDLLARHYPARPHDTGLHLLIGGVANRGRGLGSALLRAVADLVLDKRPACARVVAEPDLRNTPSVSAFLSAGFRFSAEVDLPGKRAALMVRDRSLRDLL
ncbi:acetyltransferase [Streptomyces mirabilis]|uniref:GNAT family N-acetyltransferase n=1 Tax=Streptomyces mirabilis TaxID=68239 RepID=UPI0021C03CCC|nr:GNAT family N-acetyltransferase [Streptomyces mirabilis]MCT9109940.1 acetyltransferase [Streptomyces mirabilis]